MQKDKTAIRVLIMSAKIKSPIKTIDGVDHRQCLDCPKWIPVERRHGKSVCRCRECFLEARRRWNCVENPVPKKSLIKMIDGVEHSICIYCGAWKPHSRNLSTCRTCENERQSRYKNRLPKLEKKYDSKTGRLIEDQVRERELADTKIYSWTFDGLSDTVKQALKTGDVELLLRS